MKTETLKINLAKRILSISDNSILEKINAYLDQENIIGYNANGTPITEKEYLEEMKTINAKIDNGTAQGKTTDEVKKQITDAYNLAR